MFPLKWNVEVWKKAGNRRLLEIVMELNLFESYGLLKNIREVVPNVKLLETWNELVS